MKTKSLHSPCLNTIMRTIALTFTLLLTVTYLNAKPYETFNGNGIKVGVVTASGLCITNICLGNKYQDARKIVDDDLNTYLNFDNFLSILQVSGVGIRNDSAVYPAGYVTGFLIESQMQSLNVTLLTDFVVVTYLNGVLRESFPIGNLFNSGDVLPGQKRSIISFKTTQNFNEVRLYNPNLINANTQIRIYEAFVFDPNDPNDIVMPDCDNFIQGNKTIATYNGGILAVAGKVVNLDYINNYNRTDFANFQTISNSSITNGASIGVIDLNKVYAGGTKAGFEIELTGGINILNASLLSGFTIKTYLFGTLQETLNIPSTNFSLLELGVLSTQNRGKFKIAANTSNSKPYNEIRLTFASLLNAELTSGIYIYGAFSQPADCDGCLGSSYLTSNNEFGTVNLVPNSLNPWVTWNGVTGTLGTILNAPNIIDGNATTSSTIVSAVSLSGNARWSAYTSELIPAGTFVGFEVSNSIGLIDLSLLSSINIKTFILNSITPNGIGSNVSATSKETYSAQSNTVNLSALSIPGSTKQIIGFTTNEPCNLLQLELNLGLLGVGNTFSVYNAFAIKDSDNDGIPDCYDNYEDCDNNYDENGNGIPDGCDYADLSTTLNIDNNISSFRSGDTISGTITVANNGISSAERVRVSFDEPINSLMTWTQKINGITTATGTGSIYNITNTMNVHDEHTYDFEIVTNSNYTAPSLSGQVYVSSITRDPSPECDDCQFNLTRIERPDLTILSYTSSSNISMSQENLYDIYILEVNNVTTFDTITVFISKINGFTLSLDTRTQVLQNNSINNNNGDWEFDNTSNPNYYILKSIAPINGNGASIIGLKLISTIPNLQSININHSIRLTSGGEINGDNNEHLIYLLNRP
jgi:hypothetical protein